MLITVQKPGACHAVVLEDIATQNCYKLKNSYPTDPYIYIPHNRKTAYLEHIRKNARGFGLSEQELIRKIEFNSGMKIEWDTQNDWILLDEGYALKFSLKKNFDQYRQNRVTVPVAVSARVPVPTSRSRDPPTQSCRKRKLQF